jgi:hypothetical protein
MPPRPFARVLLLSCLAIGCRLGGRSSSHTALQADIDPLRAAFNAEVGKVRVVMLLSPT